MVAIPVYIRHNISYKEGSSGRLDITVGPKQTMGKPVSTKPIKCQKWFSVLVEVRGFLKSFQWSVPNNQFVR